MNKPALLDALLSQPGGATLVDPSVCLGLEVEGELDEDFVGCRVARSSPWERTWRLIPLTVFEWVILGGAESTCCSIVLNCYADLLRRKQLELDPNAVLSARLPLLCWEIKNFLTTRLPSCATLVADTQTLKHY